MLKLTVKPGDKIFVGSGEDTIVISFERNVGAKSELGFNAPRDIPIHAVFADSSEQFKNRKNRKGAKS